MYSDESILTLSKRIGFGVPSQELQIEFSDDIVTGPSGRTFSFFHRLVTLKGIYLTTQDVAMEKEPFEAFLQQIRFDATKSVLARIVDKNKQCDPDKDYSNDIITKSALIEEAIGNAVAISVLEFMLSSERSNLHKINADLTHEKLLLQLNGFKTEKGVIVAVGLNAKLLSAINEASNSVCPFSVSVKDGKVW